jgi:hypothetical protein
MPTPIIKMIFRQWHENRINNRTEIILDLINYLGFVGIFCFNSFLILLDFDPSLSLKKLMTDVVQTLPDHVANQQCEVV